MPNNDGPAADRWAEQELISDLTLGAAPDDKCSEDTLWLVAAAPNDRFLSVIGAGPIEDLLAREPEYVAALIAREAPANVKLCTALGHCWRMPSVPKSIYESIVAFAIPMD